METKVDANATQQPDTPQAETGAFNGCVDERPHCDQPTTSDMNERAVGEPGMFKFEEPFGTAPAEVVPTRPATTPMPAHTPIAGGFRAGVSRAGDPLGVSDAPSQPFKADHVIHDGSTEER
ncbi:hypothetical protein [Burkholderia stagnalis]|uniref:hypothetical protein n=1 Tax=Burkholderia stagnalis TaxID=1503054 RepID=UPI0012D864CF|nr:hypothetical protein [Burkholderia stagnalis]